MQTVHAGVDVNVVCRLIKKLETGGPDLYDTLQNVRISTAVMRANMAMDC
jgi:hypothetical protein